MKPSEVLSILLGLVVVGVVGFALRLASAPSISMGVQVQNDASERRTIIVFDSGSRTTVVHELEPRGSQWIVFWTGESRNELTGRVFAVIALDENARVCHHEAIPGELMPNRDRLLVK
jgi:hypothetical protein